MKIEINFEQPAPMKKKKRIFLKAETILKYLISNDEETDRLILFKPQEIELVTDDYQLYLALGSLFDYDSFRRNKLTKFLEQVAVNHQPSKPVLTDQMVEEIRNRALKPVKPMRKND